MKKLLIGISTLVVLLLNGCVTPEVIEKSYTGEGELLTQLKKSCDLNNGAGCSNLGVLYFFGEGVKRNYSKAKEYYTKACNLNFGAGCSNLGALYYDGDGVKQDYVIARKYYTKGCNLDHGLGCTYLGYIYYFGLGVKKDYTKSKKYFYKGCKLNDNDACGAYDEMKKSKK